MDTNTNKKVSLFQRFLSYTEKAGNALPHPATIFASFALITLVISFVASSLGWFVVHPTTGGNNQTGKLTYSGRIAPYYS